MNAAACPVPRSCMLLLMAAQLSALAPHLWRLPWVFGAIALLALGWRALIHLGRVDYPGRLLRLLLVVLSVAGIFGFFRQPSLEPTVALLVCGTSLKLLEMRSRRDVVLVVTLGYFVAATQFLFSQSLPGAVYALLPLLATTAALVALYAEGPPPLRALRKAGVMLLQAAPLMLVLFVLFPRLGPLWSVPMPEGQARTGLGDTMAPGDVNALSLSDALAFRVRFEGEAPPQQALYWRAMSYERFDGRRWSVAPAAPRPPSGSARAGAAGGWHYEVLFEPSHRQWLVVLDHAVQVQPALLWPGDGSVQAPEPLRERYRYRVHSAPDAGAPVLADEARRRNLAVPGGNPRAQAMARDWQRQAPSAEALAGRLMAHFRREDFHYTLEPPRLGADPVDDFLFDSRRGFCEHYASAAAFMLRAAGVPARVVAGYMGGEFNAAAGYWLVHQYDAHAWVEYWREGRGWVRLDPTAAVAPERIEQGIERMLAGGEGTAAMSWRFSPVASWIRLRWDGLNYAWQRRVVQFDREQQGVLWRSLWPGRAASGPLLLLLTGGALSLLLAAVGLSGAARRGGRDPAARLYERACRRLARLGLERQPGETPGDFCRRAVQARPALRNLMTRITLIFERLSYGPPLPAEERRRLLRQLGREVRALGGLSGT